MSTNKNVLVLPFGGDHDPDKDRARDRAGTVSRQQRHTLYHLAEAGRHGLTYRELCGIADWHHGQSSHVLSVLHKAGLAARLTERRNRCLVYVLPEYVGGRDTQPQGRTSTTALLDRMATLLAEQIYDCGHGPLGALGCWSCAAEEALRQYEARR